jgi:hypothetical protein
MDYPWLEKVDTLPQQQFTVSNVALVSGTSFNLTLAPLFDCKTSRLKLLGVGWLQAPNSMHSTRVQITAINGNVVTVTSVPSMKEDPENDGDVVVDLTLYQLGTAYFYREPVLPSFWLNYWGY